MAECTLLSDRMPGVAAGRDAWSPADLAHLAECAECAGEWGLVRATARLGAGRGYPADGAALSRTVLIRVAAARRADGLRRRQTWIASALAAAAAVMLLVWGGRPHALPAPDSPPEQAIESATLLPSLDSLDAGELKEVLDAFDAPLSERVIIGTPTIGDLSDQELERMLRAGGV